MKGLKALAAVVAATGLLASAAPVTAGAAAYDNSVSATPGTGGTAAYEHYVGCGISRKAKPAHVCPKGSKKGAFFKSLQADVVYSVCVKFPSGKNLCAQKQEATKGTLYVNKVTSTIPGKHQVSWFVGGKKVGTFVFRVAD